LKPPKTRAGTALHEKKSTEPRRDLDSHRLRDRNDKTGAAFAATLAAVIPAEENSEGVGGSVL